MYPGDIKISVPELSKILRDSIFAIYDFDDTKFYYANLEENVQYYIFMGVFHLKMYEDFAYIIKYWVRILSQGYDPELKWYGSKYLDTPVGSVKQDQITHRIIKGAPCVGVQILTYHKDPWKNGWILAIPGLTNYRGFIEPTGEIVPDWVLYK